MGSELIGRDDELTRLRALVSPAPAPAHSHVLVLLGDAGMGKSALLADAADHAQKAGRNILQVTGRESEQDLAFAGLHQLLRPVLDHIPGLPERQAKALLGAFALSADPTPPDALLTGIAVLTMLTMLTMLSAQRPLLVIADDAQWLDRGSLDTLAFAARRFASEPLTLLVGARGQLPPPGFERDAPELTLTPLSTGDAGRLLDAQPHPPRGRARELILAQAAGNPMVLIELARIIAADPTAGRRWAAEPLPPTERLATALAADYRTLPAKTREALLLIAVADRPDLPITGPATEITADILAPAERAGLIKVDGNGAQFRHPLVRAAVYHAVPFAERAAAHLAIADIVRGQPDRYAWHLAAAALGPDERVAALLEATADEARRRGGVAAAARALEHAAELSPVREDRARRLLAAGTVALDAGQGDWVRDLVGQVLAITTDTEQAIAARMLIGWALIWSNRHADALATLTAVTTEATKSFPLLAWHAIGLAGTAAYHWGTPAGFKAAQAAQSALDDLEEPNDLPPDYAELQRLWISAVTGPFSQRDHATTRLHRLADRITEDYQSSLAPTAWLLDESERAVKLFRGALARMRGPGVRGGSPPMLAALQWACIDAGRWDEALEVGKEAADAAAAYKLETIAVSAGLGTATVLALRGDPSRVEPLRDTVLTAFDATENRAAAARAWHATGLAALAEGSYLTAYAQLSRLFGADGTPLHPHVSYLAVADLAAAAVHAERQLEARNLLESALSRTGPTPGPRLDQLKARARALLTDPRQYAIALDNPAGEAWPFERAQLRLDYGTWLRRQRRINNAKPELAAAAGTFRRLGAGPWTRRAEAELRAAGVAGATTSEPDPRKLTDLTTQQREIVLLAARGLTNAEIAERLFLSPRTVASHLYRAYPKLGISGRHQLHDLIQ